MKKKIILIIISLIILVSIIIGIIKYKEYREIKRIENAIIKVDTVENLSIPYNTKLKISDLISDINGQIINDYDIDTTKLGEKEITFEYLNEENIIIPHTITINIIDNTKPVVWLNNTLTVAVGTKNILDKIMCGDDLDNDPQKEIVGEYNLDKVGNYHLNYVATDFSGNKTTIPFTLKVVNKITNTYNTERIKFKKIYDKYKTDDTKIGIDVSKWQGNINFDLIKNSGIEFAIIKLGGTDGIDGEFYMDPKFERNITEFSKLNIPIGVYFYSYANTEEKAKEEALYVINTLKEYNIDLPVFFDWENWSSFNKFKVSFNTLNKTYESFKNTLAENGYESMLYGSKNYLEKIWNRLEDNVWLAHYTTKTDYIGKYAFWQATSSAVIDGITENTVDVDIWYFK